jgi:hypothetical protein
VGQTLPVKPADTPGDPAPPPRLAASVAGAAPALLLAAVGAVLLAAVRTENVNWDEFALLQRVSEFLRTGRLQGGGRPGLVELLLAPLVRGCDDALEIVWAARSLWVALTLAYLGGLWALARRLPFRRPAPGTDDALALGLLALVPVFARWGLQVRTDQPALACSLWAGVLLLDPRRRAGALAAGGALLGVGYLFSQKALYLGALALLLLGVVELSGWWEEEGPGRWRGLLARGAALAAGAAVPVLLYHLALGHLVQLPRQMSLDNGLTTFAYYRRTFGYRAYAAMVPTLVPHLVLLAGMAVATALRWRAPRDRGALLTGWAVLALGLAVGIFHAAAFPYFWLTLGVFPAVAAALVIGPIRALLPGTGLRAAATAVLATALLAEGAASARSVLRDTQAPQREALAFVDRNFGKEARGFHPEGALFCRDDPAPFPVYFTETILRRFHGPDGPGYTQWFLAEQRSRPVAFLVPSHVYGQFPEPVRSFWDQHYLPYSHAVRVAGAAVHGEAGQLVEVDLVAAGTYRWRAVAEGGVAPRAAIEGRTLGPGDRIALAAGVHQVRLLDKVRTGMVQLALEEAPESPLGIFYSMEAIGQITGRLTW